jgi:hypothetical protein
LGRGFFFFFFFFFRKKIKKKKNLFENENFFLYLEQTKGEREVRQRYVTLVAGPSELLMDVRTFHFPLLNDNELVK